MSSLKVLLDLGKPRWKATFIPACFRWRMGRLERGGLPEANDCHACRAMSTRATKLRGDCRESVRISISRARESGNSHERADAWAVARNSEQRRLRPADTCEIKYGRSAFGPPELEGDADSDVTTCSPRDAAGVKVRKRERKTERTVYFRSCTN